MSSLREPIERRLAAVSVEVQALEELLAAKHAERSSLSAELEQLALADAQVTEGGGSGVGGGGGGCEPVGGNNCMRKTHTLSPAEIERSVYVVYRTRPPALSQCPWGFNAVLCCFCFSSGMADS
jgi:hypothetical protein